MSDTARDQAQAQVASIVEMVAALECDYDRLEELRDERGQWADETGRHVSEWDELHPEEAAELAELTAAAGECSDSDDALQRIHEDALSVEVRSDWASPGESLEAGEFRIVLCTGGPHVELRGDLDRGEPCSVQVHYANWGESGEYFPTDDERAALLTYAQQFFAG